MKGVDVFCASQTATAICLSMEHGSSSPSSSILLGSSSPAIDRHNPIIADSRRLAKPLVPPSQTRLIPESHKNKCKKVPCKKSGDHREKSTDDAVIKLDGDKKAKGSSSRKSWRCTKPGDFFSPPGSTRYLLGDTVVLNGGASDFAQSLMLETSKGVEKNESCEGQDQVVVLRVSLHCRGCERKMRKHISRMEGVTSFNIDFAAKKVTISGNITPLEVLSSISKVKNAQLWSTTTNQQSYAYGQFKNGYNGSAYYMKTT